MKHLVLVVTLLFIALNPEISFSRELNYCALEEAIANKTQQIAKTYATDHDELAQLYASRGEFHLFHFEYQQALDDFQTAYLHSQQISDDQTALFSAFQAIFGAAICYDNLEMHKAAQGSIQRLNLILDCMQYCEDCTERSSDLRLMKSSLRVPEYNSLITLCANRGDDYSDIAGPNDVSAGWCSECVKNTARKMREMIDEYVKAYKQQQCLLQIVKRLENQAYNCCRSGAFWKSCVAPIARKWKEWKDFEEKFGHMPLP
jgi:hypothetical protein